MSPRRPQLAVVFGQPDRYSTSFQTRQLVNALEPWFRPLPLHLPPAQSAFRRQLDRAAINYVRPLLARPTHDYVLYCNDGAADLNHWHGHRILYWYDAPWNWHKRPPRPWQWIHWRRYRNVTLADHVFAVSAVQVDVARALRPGREDSVVYLPVGVNCRTFDPARAEPERIRTEFGLPDKTIVGYLGYIGVLAGRFAGEVIAEMAPHLLKKHDVHFLVVGFGPGLEAWKRRVEVLGLSSRFTFTGFVADESLPHCIAAMDICIDTLEEGFHSQARSETKLKQYMAMARPCVATAIGENTVDLEKGRCGMLVAPGAPALSKGVATLCEHPALCRQLGAMARRRACAVYDWSVLARRFAETLGVGMAAS